MLAELPALPAMEIPALPAGAGAAAAAASMAATMSAALSMAASLEAMLGLPIPALTPEGVAALEAMASVEGELGIGMTSPSAQADLSLAAGSLNIAAPTLGELGAALGPAMEPMDSPGVLRRRCPRAAV